MNEDTYGTLGCLMCKMRYKDVLMENDVGVCNYVLLDGCSRKKKKESTPNCAKVIPKCIILIN